MRPPCTWGSHQLSAAAPQRAAQGLQRSPPGCLWTACGPPPAYAPQSVVATFHRKKSLRIGHIQEYSDPNRGQLRLHTQVAPWDDCTPPPDEQQQSPRDFDCVNASWSTRSPTSRLSRLVSSRSALKREASFLFSVIRRRKATPGSSILPAAFSLGARRKATSRACGTPLRPAESASACRPGFFHHPILFSPSRT